MTFGCAIEALLAEGSVQQRLSEANRYIRKLQQHQAEIPDGCFGGLQEIMATLANGREDNVDKYGPHDYSSTEQELVLTEELLSLYAAVTDGALIF